MTAVDELVSWLRLQLDEDERRAPNEHRNIDDWGYYSCPAGGPDGFYKGECDCDLDERRRVSLAEVEAKRRTVDEIARQGSPLYGSLHDLLRLLARPYANRPGYREEWRP